MSQPHIEEEANKCILVMFTYLASKTLNFCVRYFVLVVENVSRSFVPCLWSGQHVAPFHLDEQFYSFFGFFS